VTPRDAARLIAAGRVLVGLGLVLAPRLAGRGWIGSDAERAPVTVLTRALGIRDLLMGLLALHVVDRPQVGARYVGACAAVDAVDFAATLAVREHLPPAAATGALVTAGGSALAGAALSAVLRQN
jgi:hypothetical protein